ITAPGVLKAGSNSASLYLAQALGGDVFFGIVAAVAFSTILAVVAGITLAAAATASHDIYARVMRKGGQSERRELWVSRIAAVLFGATGVTLSLTFRAMNVNILA